MTYLHDGVQGGERILEDEADPLAADAVEFFLVYLSQIFAVVPDLALFNDGVVGQDAHDCLDGDGLAGS